MVQPINYGAYFQRPQTQNVGLYDYVKEIEGIRKERDFRNDLMDLQGGYTSQKAANLMVKYPEFQKQMLQPLSHLDKANQESLKVNLLRLESLKNNPEQFKGLLTTLQQGFADRGDTQLAGLFDDAVGLYEKNPQEAFNTLNLINTAFDPEYANRQLLAQQQLYKTGTEEEKQKKAQGETTEQFIKNKKALIELKKKELEYEKDNQAYLKSLKNYNLPTHVYNQIADVSSKIKDANLNYDVAQEFIKELNEGKSVKGTWTPSTIIGDKTDAAVFTERLTGFADKIAIAANRPAGAGTMSDADAAMYKKGAPTEGWSVKEVEDWLKYAARVMAYESAFGRLKSKWLSEFEGDVSKTGGSIEGYKVNPQEQFDEWFQRIGAEVYRKGMDRQAYLGEDANAKKATQADRTPQWMNKNKKKEVIILEVIPN